MKGDEIQDVAKPESTIGMRHAIIFILFLSTTIAYATRVSMSVAIVAMIDEKYDLHYDWDSNIQNTILSSFFWGYIVLQIPAGMLVGRFGGKVIILWSMFLTGIFNLLVPLAANQGWIWVCVCRVAMGLVQGPLYPALHGLLGQWAPASERSRMGTFVYSGAQLGTIIEMITAGVLSDGPWGWPSIFYVAGITCIGWSVIWFFLGASTPSQSKLVKKDERKYIEMNAGAKDISEQRHMAIPWKSIWTSLPFWAIILAHSGQSLGFWTLLTETPLYMKKVLGFDVKESAILSALPYIAMYILSFIFSWTADFLVNKNITRLVTARKICNTFAFWGPAAALLALSYLPSGHSNLAVAILTITVGLNGAHYVGFLISHIDLSPNFASTLMGITNGCGNIFSILAPLSVSLVVKDDTSATEWRKVFFISIGFYFLSNLFYILFFVGKVQDWNEPQSDQISENGEKPKKHENVTARRISVGEQKF